MRLFATAAVLACASCVIAQTKVEDTPVQTPTIPPHVRTPKPGIRKAAQPGTSAGNAKAVEVPPTTPVVTLQGVCKERQPNSACKTVITREDLDRFVNASGPTPSDTARGRLAVDYARTLAFSSLAEQQGIDKNPVFAKELDAQLKLVRMRILASAYMQNVQRQTIPVAEPEVQKYYDLHRNLYDQAQVRRLAVPFVVPTESGRPLDRAEAKAEMEAIRTRAVAGEDLNQLQLDAYKHLHIQATPPPLNVVVLRRSVVQGAEATAFDLNPGELSTVLDLPAAFAILKVESKEPVPIASVRQEIEAAVKRDRTQNEVNKLTKKISAQFNLQYLDLSSQPDIFGPTLITPPAASRASVRRLPSTRP